MSTIAERKSTASRLRATDPNLAFLASRAAIELDGIRQKKTTATDAVRELAERLKNSAQPIASAGESTALWDPATISLIHNAIEARGSVNIATMADLLREATEIAEQLESTTGASSDAAEINRLRSFCIGLANSAIAHERFQIDSYSDKTHGS
jgi:hypothetical protein